MANEIGVSEGTLYTYMKIYERGTPGLIKKLEAGEVKLREAYGKISAADAPAIEVVARTVEVFHGDDSIDFNKPLYRRAVLDNTARLNKLFDFVHEHIALAGGLGDAYACRKIRALLRGVEVSMM